MNQQKLDKSFNDFQNNVLEVITLAMNDKRREVNLWRNRAQMLAKEFKACLYCASQKDWMSETMECKKCSDGN